MSQSGEKGDTPRMAAGGRRSARPRRHRRLATPALPATSAVVLAALALALALARSSSPPPPPDDSAAALVPADALAYANVSLNGPSARRALSLARRLPALVRIASALERRLEGVAGGGAGAAQIARVRAWIGDELAFALVGAQGAVADSLLVAAVAHPRAALAFLSSGGARPDGTRRGVALWVYRDGTVAALLGRDLVAGQPAGVAAAIAAWRSGVSLASTGAYRRSLAAAGPHAALEAYASAAGIREVLDGRGGAPGALGALLTGPGVQGAGVSVAPGEGALDVRVAVELSRSSAAAGHAVALLGALPADTPLALDVGDLPRAAPAILRSLADLGIAPRVGPLLARLGAALRAAGGDVPAGLSVFSGEGVVALSSVDGRPALLALARVPDSAIARYRLAALIPPLLEVFRGQALAAGFAPSVTQRTIAGVAVQQLVLEPALQIDYAVAGHLVVIATGLAALRAVLARARASGPAGGLSASAQFRGVLAARPARLSALAYLDLGRLRSATPRTAPGLALRLGSLRSALVGVRAVGAAITTAGSTARARIVVQIR